jgi:two-component system, cell cycle response regulator DivK
MVETLKKIQELIDQNKALEKHNEELKNIIDINLTQPGKEPIIPITELIGKNEIESLVFKFYHSYKIPAALISCDQDILFSIGWNKLFTTQSNFGKSIACIDEILEYIKLNSFEKNFFSYKCVHGFNTIAFPIEIRKGFQAVLLLNQFFYNDETPDFDTFLDLARIKNIKEEVIFKFLSEIPIFSHNEIDTIIKEGIILSEMISFIGTKNSEFYKRFKQQTDSNILLNSLKKKITEQDIIIKKLIQTVTEHQKDIGENTIDKSVLKKETNKYIQKLARTETVLNSILTSSPLGICFLKEGVITFANDQMYHLTGYTTKEIIGRPINYVLSESMPWKKILEQSKNAFLKDHITFSSQIIRKKGESTNIIGFLTPIQPDKPKEGYTLSILNTDTSINKPAELTNKTTDRNTNKTVHKNDWSDKTILIAEDEELNYLYLKHLLSPTNINIKWAKNGQKAIDFYNEDPNINVILMDIKMPVLNGIEVTHIIKSINKQIPIIAQTAYVQENTKEAIINAGCDDFLAKPINTAYFMAILEKILC